MPTEYDVNMRADLTHADGTVERVTIVGQATISAQGGTGEPILSGEYVKIAGGGITDSSGGIQAGGVEGVIRGEKAPTQPDPKR
jgi:hypothetical protein